MTSSFLIDFSSQLMLGPLIGVKERGEPAISITRIESKETEED